MNYLSCSSIHLFKSEKFEVFNKSIKKNNQIYAFKGGWVPKNLYTLLQQRKNREGQNTKVRRNKNGGDHNENEVRENGLEKIDLKKKGKAEAKNRD